MKLAVDQKKILSRHEAVVRLLLDQMNGQDYWCGELASSALATSVAVYALHLTDHKKYERHITQGVQWLIRSVNADGGWGDTDRSNSNISTTLLCMSALNAISGSSQSTILENAENYIQQTVGPFTPQSIVDALKDKYNQDRSFASPILSVCVLAGLFKKEDSWKMIDPLPFELAVLPHRFFQWIHLPVVSYAMPALIALGQLQFFKNPPVNPLIRCLRRISVNKTLKVLESIQPENGGFLEAIPLTAFVAISLIETNQKESVIVKKAIDFILSASRPDGSWPIDTTLETWVTTLAVNALSCNTTRKSLLDSQQRNHLTSWILDQQFKAVHPYTQALPGGFGWCARPGSVPDADDTAGALIALKRLNYDVPDKETSVKAAIQWLIILQNRDGGIPTFCKGWNRLDFDRSSPDITAHTILAWSLWKDQVSDRDKKRMCQKLDKAFRFLQKSQTPEGCWIPLWFGNENEFNQSNPIYGTSKVLSCLCDEAVDLASCYSVYLPMVVKAVQWLIHSPADIGSLSIEETAVVLDALASLYLNKPLLDHFLIRSNNKNIKKTISIYLECLLARLENNDFPESAPIGLYFAKLWYYESLYPLIFSVSALSKIKRILQISDMDFQD